MAESGGRGPQAVPVESLSAGDHACLAHGDSEVQWRVLTAFTRAGLAKNEKVLLVLDAADLEDDEAVARMDGGTGRVAAARDSGQVAFGRTSSFYLPDGRFDEQRQVATIAGEIERAEREGWPRLRAAGNMSWVAEVGLPTDDVVDYEASVEPLFADSRFTAICWYDRRRLNDYLVAAACEVHPVQVLDRLEVTDITQTADGARITSTANTGTELVEALYAVLEQQTAPGPYRFELDLTDLTFIEAQSVGRLISFAAALPAGSKLTVDCGPLLEVALRSLDADAVPQLELRVEEEP